MSATFDNMKVLRRKVALEVHRSNIVLYAYPAELIHAESTSQNPKNIAGWEKSSVDRGVKFETFPQEIMTSEYARIQILTLRVRWK